MKLSEVESRLASLPATLPTDRPSPLPPDRQKLVEDYLPLALACAARVTGSRYRVAAGYSTLDPAEAVSGALDGLHYAARNWDPSRGSFAMFARHQCRSRAARQALRAAGWRRAADGDRAWQPPPREGFFPSERPDPSAADPAEAAVRVEERSRVAAAVDALPPTLAWVVRLHWWRGLTTGEIGRRLGWTSETVRQKLIQACGLLRAALADNG